MKTMWVNVSETAFDGTNNINLGPTVVPEPEDKTCPAIGYQSLSICAPVKVEPFAKPGATTTKCCGKPIVKPGIELCPGEKKGACYFTITQKLCVEVPVEFGAVATVGDPSVDCIDASELDICSDCDSAVTPGSDFDTDCGCQ
ncbi:MAG: hypothetical protein FWF44_06475 [Defluviitaleaceae bacterium]|nr:hypothetical protein [Defluviitaleaceae bacterium]